MVETVEVPFVTLGNRQVLTDRQITEQPWLKEFMARFPRCFSRDDQYFVYVFDREGHHG
jgi:hypothetical protein